MIVNDLKPILKASRVFVYKGKSKKVKQFRNMKETGLNELYENFGEYEISEITGFSAEDEVIVIKVRDMK